MVCVDTHDTPIFKGDYTVPGSRYSGARYPLARYHLSFVRFCTISASICIILVRLLPSYPHIRIHKGLHEGGDGGRPLMDGYVGARKAADAPK